jgi:hypothetical protein
VVLNSSQCSIFEIILGWSLKSPRSAEQSSQITVRCSKPAAQEHNPQLSKHSKDLVIDNWTKLPTRIYYLLQNLYVRATKTLNLK